MAETGQYIEILLESLRKKKMLLEAIQEENQKQEAAVKADGGLEAFDKTVKKKGRLIRELNGLDDGFETVYARIKEELAQNPTAYRNEIAQMQRLIAGITELSVSVQASEQRNKQLVEGYFSYTKGKIRHAKKSMQVAAGYYKAMSGANFTDSQLMDRKK